MLPYPGAVRDGEAEWTADQFQLLQTLLAGAGAPFGPWNNRPDAAPPQERAFITAPPPQNDMAPVEKPTLDLLTDAVRSSGQVERINRWLTEAAGAGVPFSPLAMPNVGNYERLRTALRLAEFAEDDPDLSWVIVRPDEPVIGAVGEAIGRLTSAEAQAVWQRIDDLANGRSTLLYSPEGAPRVIDSISAP